MVKFIFKDGPDMMAKPQSFFRGDIIAVIEDHHDFGTEELARPLFACVYIPDMEWEESRVYNSILLPDETGKYIPRPSLYTVDLDSLLGPDYMKTGQHERNRSQMLLRMTTRDPLLNPGYGEI